VIDVTGHGEKRSRKTEQAVAALLNHATIEDAAKAVDVAVITLRRWVRDENFRSEYERARRQLMEHAAARLQQASSLAVETLRGIMQDESAPASARAMAARIVLEMGQRATELYDLEGRVSFLERVESERCAGPRRQIRVAR
jgi:hypothetical protein